MIEPQIKETVRSIVDAAEYWARTRSDSPFITFTESTEPESTMGYGEFMRCVGSVSQVLTDAGLSEGDACLVHMPNCPEFVVALFAIWRVGATAVPTILDYAVDELTYAADHSGAWGVLTVPEHAAQGDHLAGVLGIAAGVLSGDSLSVAGRALPADASADPGRAGSRPGSRAAILMYTSGSTSRPKGVLLGHQGIEFTARSYAEHLRLTAKETVLVCMPLFHVNGLMFQLLPAVYAGAQVVLAPKFSIRSYWDWVETSGVTVCHLVSGPIRLLLEQAKDSPRTLRRPPRLMSFGLPLDDEEMSRFEQAFGIPLVMIWGLTETCCGGTLMPLDHRRRPEHQNVGQALLGWSVRAVDPAGQDVPPGEVGELVVKSPGVMLGYHRDPDATAVALRDGYVYSEDLGSIDDEGYVHFASRAKDMLKPNGENVAAVEVQTVLEQHPDVSAAVVFGVPDPIRVERVIAAVLPVDGRECSEQTLKAYCSDRLAGFKVPNVVMVVDKIPRTSIGKARVSDLRSLFEVRNLTTGEDDHRV